MIKEKLLSTKVTPCESIWKQKIKKKKKKKKKKKIFKFTRFFKESCRIVIIWSFFLPSFYYINNFKHKIIDFSYMV